MLTAAGNCSANRPAAFQRSTSTEVVRPLGGINPNLIETRHKHPHLHSITALTFAFGSAGF